MEAFPQHPLSTAEAAKHLGVSVRRVQALAAAGALPSWRVGTRLVFDAREVRRRASAAHPSGRPFDPRSAWAVLACASGRHWPEENASLRWRNRRRSADLVAAAVGSRFRRRASLHPFQAAAADVAEIAEEEGLVFGGVSVADEYGIDIVAPNMVEAYVDEASLDRLRRRYWMEPSTPASANVLLRVVPDAVWSVIGRDRCAPSAAAAVDLLESDDDRSRRAGKQLLDRVAATS
jgi:excisionase family DNA binding protein